MAIALLAHTAAGSLAGSPVTTPGIDSTGANLLVAFGVCYRGVSQVNVPTISDSKGNTWTQLTDRGSANTVIIRTWYCLAPTVGTGHTFTFGGNNNPVFPAGAVAAFSGVKTSSPFDQQNGAAVSPGTSLATGSVTPTEGNELICAGLSWGNTDTPAVDNGMTILDTVAQSGGAHEGVQFTYKIQTSAAAINPNFSWTISTEAAAEIATFKSATAPDVSVNLTGVAATASIGTPTETGNANVAPSGQSAAASPGSETIAAGGNATPAGLAATASPGALTVVPSIAVPLDGHAATASAGTPTADTDVNIAITGHGAIATPGSLLVPQSTVAEPRGQIMQALAGVLFNGIVPDLLCCEGPYRLLSIFEILIPPPTLNALIYTNLFTEGPTSGGSNDLGTKVIVTHAPSFATDRSRCNITHDSDGDCLHFDYGAGDGHGGITASADMSFAVGGILALLEDSDQLAQSICAADNSVPGSLTRCGPAVFMTGTWNSDVPTAYYISNRPDTAQCVLARINGSLGSETGIGALKSAPIGSELTITAKDNGATVRIRLFVDGVQVDEVTDSSSSRIHLPAGANSLGWMGVFCSAPQFSKWTPLICAIPIP